METATTANATAVNAAFGKATVGTSAITVAWIKEYTNTLYSFLNTSCCIDEFQEVYISSTLRLKSDNTTKDSFWVGKVDTDGDLIWNYRYLVSGGSITMAQKCSIDIFGDLNLTTSFLVQDLIQSGINLLCDQSPPPITFPALAIHNLILELFK